MGIHRRNEGEGPADVAAPLRFWSKVRKQSCGCWLWTAARAGGRTGVAYGWFKLPGTRRNVYAHRFAYCLSRGISIRSLRRSDIVRHRCDVTLCVRPQHLVLGTQAQNVADYIRRGRRRR